jgi:hypothetical protein
MARRLGSRLLVQRFLAADRQPFAAATQALGHSLRLLPGDDFVARVRDSIELLNIAGLCNSSKRNWYGVDLNDVIAGAEKLGKTKADMRAILRNAAWANALK